MSQFQKFNFAVKPFQGRVFVIAVAGDKLDFFVFKVLDEVDGKETFADTALAIQNEVESFSHICSSGFRSSTLAICGPRDRNGLFSVGAGGMLLVITGAAGNAALLAVSGALLGAALWLTAGAAVRATDGWCDGLFLKTR
jgi:hypothetical protein